VCADTDADEVCSDQAANEREAITAGDSGDLTQDPGQLVAVSPNATNIVGTAHTFTFSLSAGVTCASDADPLPTLTSSAQWRT
jgi:hypothetical protein